MFYIKLMQPFLSLTGIPDFFLSLCEQHSGKSTDQRAVDELPRQHVAMIEK